MPQKLFHITLLVYLLFSLKTLGQTSSENQLYEKILEEFRQLEYSNDTLNLFLKIDSVIVKANQEHNCIAETMAYYIKAYVLRDNFLESVNHYLIGSYVGRSCGNSVIHLKQMQSIFNNLGKVASRYNEYDLAIHFFEEGLSYAYQLNDTSKILQELYQIGLTHYHKGNYHQTLFMLDLAKPYQRKSSWKRTQSEITIANALHNLDKLDEALEIEKALILKLNSDTTHNRRQAYFGILYNNIGNIFRDKSEIDSAIFYYKKAILFKKSLVGTKLNYGFLMGSISSLSELYLENKEYVNARRVLLKGVKYIEGGDDQNLANNKYNLEVYQQLVQLYKALEKKDSVVFFKEKYRNQLNRYTDFSKKRNVQFLVDKFNAEREREELDARNEVYLFWFLAMVFAICFLGIIIFFFHRKKSKRVIEMTEHDKRLAELKALKAQVNPHFLFNSLNSIYSFILEEDGEHAEEYLLKYGKLMRKILDHSNLLTVPLNDELETLRLYVDLERLRLGYDFHYEVHINIPLSEENISFPSMIIQPFIENAIWHGIAHLEDRGRISLSIDQKNENIEVKIRDNGFGLNDKTKTSHHTVHGIDLIRERLELLMNRDANKDVLSIISDKEETCVSLIFPAEILKDISHVE